MKNTCKKFTEKDIAYVTDMFSWNLQALKLANHFINEAKDNEVKDLLEETFNMHYDNLNKCISILESNSNEEEYYEEEYEDEEDYTNENIADENDEEEEENDYE